MYKIAFISQPEYFRFIYENDLDSLGEVREFPYNFDMGEECFADLVEFNADFNFFFRGEFCPDSILKILPGIKINLSSEPFPSFINGKLNFTRDSFLRYKSFKQIARKSFDYVFHYDESSLSFFRSENMMISGIFPFPVATGMYKKLHLEKKWDFFFIGRSTVHRERFFAPLKHRYNFLHICHGIWGKDLVQYINQSNILLNVHAENEISWEPRVQMLIATGNLVISEKISQNSYLVPGEDYVEVSTCKDFIEAAEYYIHNEEERLSIAHNGLNKIKSKLDSKVVFEAFFRELKLGLYPKFINKNPSSNNIRLEVLSRMHYFHNKLRDILWKS